MTPNISFTFGKLLFETKINPIYIIYNLFFFCSANHRPVKVTVKTKPVMDVKVWMLFLGIW